MYLYHTATEPDPKPEIFSQTLPEPDPKPKSPTPQSLAPGKVQRAAGKEQRAQAWKQSAQVKFDKITTEKNNNIFFLHHFTLFFIPIRQDQAEELRGMEEKLQELLENYGERSRYALSWSL